MTNRLPTNARVRIALLVLALAATACTDVTASGPAPVPPLQVLTCRASVAEARVACDAPPPMAARAEIFGGQGTNVQLASSNVAYDAGTEAFTFDVTLTNLRASALGSPDGTASPRVFFHDGPVATVGTGIVTVENADGTMVGTGANQPYFEYCCSVPPDGTSAPRTWRLSVPPSVQQFAFRVYVSAPLHTVAPFRVFSPGQHLDHVYLAAGGNTTCASADTGLHCWGENASGQAGASGGGMVTLPFRLAHAMAMPVVYPGETHACATSFTEGVWCWGDNAHGQLGTGDSAGGPTPRQAATPTPFHRAYAGRGFTCGLDGNGYPYCWGDNTYGTLGDGTTASHPLPAAIDWPRFYEELDVGGETACASVGLGEVTCWGRNDWGQLGRPSTATCAGVPCSPTPDTVRTAYRMDQTVVGESFACGVGIGAVICWGRNDHGQLGVGGTDSIAPPSPVIGLSSVTLLAAGDRHACALVAAQIRCWGWRPAFGGGTGWATEPEPAPNPAGLTFLDVAAGAEHTCGFAIETWAYYCWGQNGRGQLGNGTLSPAGEPVRVAGQRPPDP